MIKIFENKIDKDILLKLYECSNGSVDLCIVDEKGDMINHPYILNISQDSITFYKRIDDILKIDDYGYPIIKRL